MKKITQAVILAGGAGTRLKPFTLNNPKPMIPINGKPFLEHLFLLLKNNGIKEVVTLTGHLGEKIQDYFKNGLNFGLNIKYSHLPFSDEKGEEIKSGLRIKNAKNLLDELFLLLYCDNYWPMQIDKLINYFEKRDGDALVTIYSNKDNAIKNNILVDKDGYVIKYDKNREEKNLNGVDVGFFILKKKVLDLLPDFNSQFEIDIIPKLIEMRKLIGFTTDHKYYSIGDMIRVPFTEKFLLPKKVVFLDRDGVINQQAAKSDYIKKWEDFIFLPGAIDAIKLLNNHGFDIYLISNQAGVARGIMTEKDLKLIHKNMQLVLKKHGAKINGIYYCPHGWNDGCECRKPKPGLLFKASNENHIDLTKTIFIGDNITDLQAGEAAGCKTIQVDPRRNLLQIVRSITT